MSVYYAVPRFVDETEGVRIEHCFSAGSHYDPEHLSYGPVMGCDLHTVAPGAGFDWHAHRGVVIVSWLLAGTLRHEDDGERALDVTPGSVLVQATGDGIRHRETNPSTDEPLRFVQLTLLADAERSVTLAEPPASLPGGAVLRLGEPADGGFAVRVGDQVLGLELTIEG